MNKDLVEKKDLRVASAMFGDELVATIEPAQVDGLFTISIRAAYTPEFGLVYPCSQRAKDSVKNFKTIDAAICFLKEIGITSEIRLSDDVYADRYIDPMQYVTRTERKVVSEDGSETLHVSYTLKGGSSDA